MTSICFCVFVFMPTIGVGGIKHQVVRVSLSVCESIFTFISPEGTRCCNETHHQVHVALMTLIRSLIKGRGQPAMAIETV